MHLSYPVFATGAVLYLIQIYPAAVIMKRLTSRWRKELETSEEKGDSLQSAGMWIGILERLLIVTFVLANQYMAIGFLIAAKSILRFGDQGSKFPRKQSEYILIGTLLSFCFAIFSSLIALYIMRLYA